MLNPKVSVITITYNLLNAGREHMFRQCIDSVYTQNNLFFRTGYRYI